jgi:RNA polymerase sigma-70 factor (ECF subfamily)
MTGVKVSGEGSVVDRQAAFDEIYERHYRSVLAYCIRRVGPLEARSVANEVMAIAWRRFDDLPPGDEVRPWLYGVARRVLAHHWRSGRRRRRLVGTIRDQERESPVDPGTVVVMRDEFRRVLAALEELGDQDREVLRLAGWEGLSHREIAGILGCSVAAVDQRLHRAKRRLADKYRAIEHAAALRRSIGIERSGGNV